MAQLYCTAKGCSCGEPVEIRQKGSRKVPIHVNRGKRSKVKTK